MNTCLDRRHIISLAALMVAVNGGGADVAQAQVSGASPSALDEVVVTAQRRSENLQDVPIAVTAITAERLTAAGVVTTATLGAVTPAVTWSNVAGTPEPRIRGIGNSTAGIGVENSVAIYVDGVYIGAPKGSLLSLNDIERVEVLKGPQGTLFGRNATAGVVQVVTKDPAPQVGGKGAIALGSYDTVEGSFYLTGPVTQSLAADLSLRFSHQGRGYGTNVFNGDDTYKTRRDFSARSKWLLELGDATTVRAAFDFSRVISSDPANPWLPGTVTPATGVISRLSRYDVDANVSPLHTVRSGGGSLKIDQKISGLTLTSISALRESRFTQLVDSDGSTLPITVQRYTEIDNSFSQEFQIAPSENGRLNWVLGAYYFDLTGKYRPYGFVSGPPGNSSATNLYNTSRTKSLAGFGQATYELLADTNLTAGFRYTQDKRSLEGTSFATSVAGVSTASLVTPAEVTYKTPTWRISLDHKFSDQVMGYVSYNRGYKSGGYNGQSSFLFPRAQVPYAPENIDAYEIGAKSEILDRRVRINISAFLYDYANIQVNTYLGPGNIPVIYNGAKSRIYGLDADFDIRATESLTVNGGLVLLHDRFTSFPLAPLGQLGANGRFVTTPGPAKGNRLPFAPDASAHLGFLYKVDVAEGVLSLAANSLYSTGYYTQVDNQRVLHQKPYGLLGGSIAWRPRSGRYDIMVWGNNLLNEDILTLGVVSGAGALVSYQAPRTFGVRLGAEF